jgi:hypothetical protein
MAIIINLLPILPLFFHFPTPPLPSTLCLLPSAFCLLPPYYLLLITYMNLSTNFSPIYLAAAGDLSTLAASSATTALQATERFWTGMYNGSGVFGELSVFCMGLAFLFVLWNVYQLYEEYREQPDYSKIISKLILPIIILAMLHQSGAMAKGFTRNLRTLSSEFGVKIILKSGSDVFVDSLQRNMPPGMKANQIIKDFTRNLDKCRIDSNPGICGSTAAAKMMRDLNAMNPPPDATLIAYASDLQTQVNAKMQAANGSPNGGINWDSVMRVFSKGLPSLGDIGEQIIITLLNAVVICFYWAMELATLLIFYLFPIALAMGVLDKKAIVDWFTSYWAICNAKICFAIVLALIGQVGTVMEGASFVIELLGAIFAPTIAFMMAKGSALAMAEGFQGATTGAVMGVAKGAGGMVQKGREKRDTNKKAQKAENAQNAAQAAQASQNSRILKALAIGRRGQ